MLFIASLSLQRKSPATARSYISAISTWHKLHNLSDHTNNFLVVKALSGFTKICRTQDVRRPITAHILAQVLGALNSVCSSTYESALFRAAFTTAFFVFFRVSELVSHAALSSNTRALKIGDITIPTTAHQMIIHLRYSKTDQSGKGTRICISSIPHSPLCPVAAMVQYLQVRPPGPADLFVHFNTNTLTRYQFQALLKKAISHLGIDHQQYSSHSFRIGAATSAAMNGVASHKIQEYGRWHSSCYRQYVRW